MAHYKTLVITTKYWKPKEDYTREIIHSISGKIANGDFLTISEKAISIASNNIIDENTVIPNLAAKLIARLWMRIMWGYFLGPLCHFKQSFLQHLREYPSTKGSAHKEVALKFNGVQHALMFGSEGGIDASNLPYSFVCLPLKNARKTAQLIHKQVWHELRKKVTVIIVDTDKTYSFRNFNFTPRPEPIKGIHSFGGVLTFVFGRALNLKRRATPLAVAGQTLETEEALRIADIANRARGFGAGRTVWDMAERFDTNIDQVTWEMLDIVRHKPIVIVRSKR